jgi:hypothetical protein
MKSSALHSLVLTLACTCLLFVCPLYAQDGQFYSATTCTPDPNSLLLVTTVSTANDLGITFKKFAVGTITLRCAVIVHSSDFFDILRMLAEDNTPTGGAVTLTLYEQKIGFYDYPFGSPTALLSVSTVSGPGLQTPESDLLNVTNGTLDPVNFMYWIEIKLTRKTAANPIVYAASLEDVL